MEGAPKVSEDAEEQHLATAVEAIFRCGESTQSYNWAGGFDWIIAE